MDSLFCRTILTLNLTTPVESASTSFNHNNFLRAITSPTTHEVAAVDTDGRIIAQSPVCAFDAELGILLAETWGGFQVDQVLGAWGFVLWVVGFQLEAVLVLLSPADGALGVGVGPVDAVS